MTSEPAAHDDDDLEFQQRPDLAAAVSPERALAERGTKRRSFRHARARFDSTGNFFQTAQSVLYITCARAASLRRGPPLGLAQFKSSLGKTCGCFRIFILNFFLQPETRTSRLLTHYFCSLTHLRSKTNRQTNKKETACFFSP